MGLYDFRVQGLGLKVWLQAWDLGLGFGILGLMFRVRVFSFECGIRIRDF